MDELNRLSVEDFKETNKNNFCIILDDIRSMNNVGSAFRTADAFNVEKIYLCGICACPPHRDIHKTALGATETVAWEYRSNILELTSELKQQGYAVCTVEQTEETTMLQDIHALPDEKFALVFGNEVNGVNQQVIDASNYVIEIPQFGTKHSLNVSVCAGIVMWEFCKRYI